MKGVSKMAFTGTLTECRITSFEQIVDDRDKTKVTHFAIIQEKWGDAKWVKLLDPNQRELFPVMHEGTAIFEQAFVRKNVISERDGKDKAKSEVNLKILALLDFKPVK